MLKKRGRKREKWEIYLEKSQARITEIRNILKTAKKDGVSVDER